MENQSHKNLRKLQKQCLEVVRQFVQSEQEGPLITYHLRGAVNDLASLLVGIYEEELFGVEALGRVKDIEAEFDDTNGSSD